jgi:hypothetical protein
LTRLVKPFLLFAIAVALSLPLAAQETSGSVTGQVTDPTGAFVAGAQVTLLQPSKSINRTATTNGQGQYTFDDVPIGTYELDTTATGFQKFVVRNLVVNVATVSREDVHLHTGDVSVSVEVNAEAIQVPTDNGAIGSVVDGTQVKELPLNGRSFVELTQMTTGVSPANNFDSKNKGLQGGVDFSVNGNPTTNNLFLVDGSNDNDVGSNRTILIYPSIESIAEFKMLTNSYGPEYGQASGAVITIATRSGTNTFHGSAFYDGRNDALATYTYFAARNAGRGLPLNGKDKLRRNDWGYSIGGPVWKDHLFFFFNQEWNHEIRGYTQSSCVPTAAERAGDFSSPSCGAPLPNIPVSLQKPGNPYALNAVDASGALLPQYFPLPNLTTPVNGNNWSVSLPTFLKYRQENARVDYALGKRNNFMGRYTQDSWSNPAYNGNQYWGDSVFPVINGNWAQPSKMAIGRWTSTVTNTLVNDAEFAYSNNRINITPGGTDPGLLTEMSKAFPTLYSPTLKNAPASTPTLWSGLGQYGNYTNIQSIAPWNNTLDIYTFRDDVSKVLGRHVLKAGLFLGWDGKNEDTSTASSERPTFQAFDYAVDQSHGGVITGNPLTNVMIPNNPFFLAENSTNLRAQLRWRDREFYVGDTWRVSQKLTLNLGVRYSMLPPPFQPENQITSFQPQLYDKSKPASDACNGLWVAPGTDPCGAANKKFGTNFSSGVQGPNKYLIDVNNHLFAPRLGLAYDVRGNGKTAIRAGFGQFYQRERVSRYTLVSNAPFVLAASNVSRALGGATPTTLSGSSSPSGGMDPAAILPNSYQWNLSVDQELAKNTVFRLSYVGNRGEHLTSSYDVNSVAPQNWLAATFAQGAAQQALRPYSNFGSLAYWSHNGDSNYHSLQTALKTQMGGLHLEAAYTWSHTIADIVTDDSSGGTGAQSFTYFADPGLDRGNAATNRPNIFVANGTYLLPRLSGHSTLMQETVGGWELTGITTAASGNSFTVLQNSVTDINGGPVGSLFYTGLTGNQRPLYAPGQSCNSGNISGNQVINAQSFTLVGYHLGTLEPGMARRGSCGGPKLVNTDLSVDKNWKVGERVTIQFRLDAFDIFNHANFRADQVNSTNPITGVRCGSGPCSITNNLVTSETRNATFGQSTGLVGNAQRQLQYGLHVEF